MAEGTRLRGFWEARAKLDRALRKGKISKMSHRHLVKWHEAIANALESQRGRIGEEAAQAIAQMVRRAALTADALETRAFNRSRDGVQICNETAKELFPKVTVDVILIPNGGRLPRTLCRDDSRGMTLVIWDSAANPLARRNFLSLLCHEVAHGHDLVREIGRSNRVSNLKRSEILADMFAFAFLGEGYPRAFAEYAEALGLDFGKDSTEHPSPSARLQAMHDEAPEIWKGGYLRRVSLSIAKRLVPVTGLEQELLRESLADCVNHRNDWRKHALDGAHVLRTSRNRIKPATLRLTIAVDELG